MYDPTISPATFAAHPELFANPEKGLPKTEYVNFAPVMSDVTDLDWVMTEHVPYSRTFLGRANQFASWWLTGE